jgi:hypothetical protein
VLHRPLGLSPKEIKKITEKFTYTLGSVIKQRIYLSFRPISRKPNGYGILLPDAQSENMARERWEYLTREIYDREP